MAWPALAIGAIVSTTRLAVADAELLPLELEWQAPDGCPDAEAVRGRVEAILRGPLTDASRAVARGAIARTEDGRFRLELTVRTGDVADARSIDSAACATLADAFAVVVALAIDPTRSADAEGAPPARAIADGPRPPDESPSARVSPLPREAPAPRASPAPEAGTRVALGLGGSVVWGPLPEPSPGLVASVGVRRDRVRVGALGTLALRQTPHFDRSAGASIDMLEGGAFAGYLLPLGIFALGPAVNVEATYVRARGFGIRRPSTSSAVWATAVVGARLEARAARWLGAFARADLLVPFDAPRFALGTQADSVRLHTPAALAPRLTLGAEILLP